jgi:hypothetical protein
MQNDEHARDNYTTCDPHSAQDILAALEVNEIMRAKRKHHLHQLTLLYVS